jgi:regulator of sigma E protease
LLTHGLTTANITFEALAAPDSPAAKAGIIPGETIISINQTPVASRYFYQERLNWVKNSIHQSAGQPLQLATVLPNGTPATHMVTPNTEGLIGVKLGLKQMQQKMQSMPEALWVTSRYFVYMIEQQIDGLGKIFTGKVAAKELSGPIGIVTMGAQVIEQEGIVYGLILTANLSIILAFMNLLPIPALDGGHLLFIFLEGIFRKPVPKRIQERFVTTGFVSLLLLMGFVLLNDVNNLFNKPAAPATKTTADPAPAGK